MEQDITNREVKSIVNRDFLIGLLLAVSGVVTSVAVNGEKIATIGKESKKMDASQSKAIDKNTVTATQVKSTVDKIEVKVEYIEKDINSMQVDLKDIKRILYTAYPGSLPPTHAGPNGDN